MISRGIRNNNPLNIEFNNIEWDGMSDEQTDGRFAQFDEPLYGIRAAARILLTYQRKYELMTVSEMLNRWAPSEENDTASYIEHVCKEMQIGPNDPVNLEHHPKMLEPMLTTMILHENGSQPYDCDLIREAIRLALK